jgi:hypothetical protein
VSKRKPLEHKQIDLPSIPWKMDKDEKRWHRKFNEEYLGAPKPTLLHLQLQEAREDAWRATVLAFEANPGDFYNAWKYLANHPVFWTFGPLRDGKPPLVHERTLQHEYGMTFEPGIEISVHRVDPKTGRASDDDALNTRTGVWWELSLTHWPTHANYPVRIHDYAGDGGAKTYEKAVVKAAKRVHDLYGNDRRILDAEMRTDRVQQAPEPVAADIPTETPSCTHEETWHDRADPCGTGHDYCADCGEPVGSRCPLKGFLPTLPITVNTRKPAKWRFVDTDTGQTWRWTKDGFKLVQTQEEES